MLSRETLKCSYEILRNTKETSRTDHTQQWEARRSHPSGKSRDSPAAAHGDAADVGVPEQYLFLLTPSHQNPTSMPVHFLCLEQPAAQAQQLPKEVRWDFWWRCVYMSVPKMLHNQTVELKIAELWMKPFSIFGAIDWIQATKENSKKNCIVKTSGEK